MPIHCGDLDTLSLAYLDGELGGDERGVVEHHLAVCPPCHARIARDRADLAELRAALRAPRAPEGFRTGIDALLDREDRTAGRPGWRWALPGAAAVAAAAALALFAFDALRAHDPVSEPARPPLSVAAVQQEAAVSRLRTGAPLVAASSRSEVSRSVGEYLRIPVTAPRFADPSTSLRGWQPTQLGGRVAAKLVYDARAARGGPIHRVDVHVLASRDLGLGGSERVEVDGKVLWVSTTLGIHTVAHRAGAVGYVFTSDMPRGQLIDLVLTSDLIESVNDRLFGD
jgi:anti-sigma factor RsiW